MAVTPKGQEKPWQQQEGSVCLRVCVCVCVCVCVFRWVYRAKVAIGGIRKEVRDIFFKLRCSPLDFEITITGGTSHVCLVIAPTSPAVERSVWQPWETRK